jgi:dephospho-CoA kinase
MNKNKKIIAIIGMCGSGKTEAVEYLQKKYKWPKVYLGAVVLNNVTDMGLELNQKNEKPVREQLRKEFGMGACASLSLPKIQNELKNNDAVLIESLYSWDEYKILKNKYADNLFTIAIYAPTAVRLERLKKRKIRPIKSYKEIKNRDWTEIEGTDKGGPIAIADFTIINEGSKKTLHINIDKTIKKIYK